MAAKRRGRRRKPLSKLSASYKATLRYRAGVKRAKGKARPGAGGRFKALSSALAKRPGVRTPGALSAWIGRKKYGKKQMTKWAVAGRKRARKRG